MKEAKFNLTYKHKVTGEVLMVRRVHASSYKALLNGTEIDITYNRLREEYTSVKRLNRNRYFTKTIGVKHEREEASASQREALRKART